MNRNASLNLISLRAGISLILALTLGGCASTEGLLPQLQIADPAGLATARSLDSLGSPWPDADWWKALGDSQLDTLIAEALQGSPDLAAVDARVRQATVQAQRVDANRSPSVTAMGTVQGLYIPETVAEPPLGGSFQSFKVLGLNAGYTTDFWGGERAAWEAALGQQHAAEVDANAARLILSVDIARAYARLGYAFQAYDLALEDDKRAAQLLALTRQRVAAGIDSIARQRAAESAAASAKQHLFRAEHEIEQDRIALAALVGKGPDRGIDIARPSVLKPIALALPDNLPADLIGRRPDIVAARWRVEAASRHIDAAQASFYPSFNLTAALGLMSFHTDDLLSLRSRYYMLAPAVSLPVFDGGRLRANLAGRDADYDLAVAQYNKTLVSAFNQVAAQVKATQSLVLQEDVQKRAVDTAREAWDLAMQRYKRGIDSYTEALNIQQSLLAAEMNLTAIHLQQIDTSVDLVQALGGGYRSPGRGATPAPAVQNKTTSTPS